MLEPTKHLLGVDVVEEPVGGELLPVLAPDIVVEHLQLGLALVELGEVPLLQRYPGMDLVHLQGLQPYVTFSSYSSGQHLIEAFFYAHFQKKNDKNTESKGFSAQHTYSS